MRGINLGINIQKQTKNELCETLQYLNIPNSFE